MGFYGNITNTSRTQFQFDKIYSNRKSMDQNRVSDNVYLGRYVLIEYDGDGLDGMKRIWKNGNNYYFSTDTTQPLTKQNTANNEVFYRAVNASGDNPADLNATSEEKVRTARHIFYKCSHGESSITLTQINDSANQTQYTTNYNIDMAMYNGGRGYDSTVWQKVYTDGIEKYVMIAELNTVVPTFDIATDAPTMVPVAPHFDTQSTDVYYKLHMQNPWVVRVAEATSDQQSDSKTKWVTVNYDPNAAEGQRYSTEEIEKDAAIYFNKAAFDKQIGKASIEKTVDGDNKIVMSLATSGQAIYDDHNNTTVDPVTAKDIQELTINLPAIGNMMSDAWDIIHGPLRNNARTDANSSLQGRLDSFKEIEENQIPVKRATDGTLIGSKINSALKYDDWDDKPTEILNDDGVTPEFVRDDAWIETTIDTSGLVGGVKNGDSIDQSGNSGISIHHTFHATEDSVTSLDKNTGNTTKSSTYKVNHIPVSNLNSGTDDTIALYTPYVDAKGHVVGKNIEIITLPYGYKTFKTSGLNEENSKDIYTTITNDSNGANTSEASAAETITVANNTQDTMIVAPGNKWIQTKFENDKLAIAHEVHAVHEVPKSTNLNTNNVVSTKESDKIVLQDIEFDTAGHVTKNQKHTYTLPYGFKTIKTNGRGDDVDSETQKSKINTGDNVITTDVVAENTQDELIINSGNKWIRIDTDATSDSITITHDVHSTSSTNNTTDWTTTEINTTIPTVTYTYDDAGHYVSHHTENYKLPFGYGKIKGDSGNTAATATYDELTFTSDEWLTATVDEDKVTYSHDYPKKVEDTKTESDVNGKSDTIVLETLVRDEKGHVTNVNQNTVTLPYGYKTIKTNGEAKDNDIDIVVNMDVNNASTSADNTQDTLNINVGNKWLHSKVENDTIILAHEVNTINTSATASTDLNTKVNGVIQDDINIPDWTYDEAGHITSKQDHKYILPYGYKTFTGDNGSTSADNTQDSMSITGDSWVQTTVSDDEIAITHIGPVSGTNTVATTPKPEFGETFSFDTYDFDNKGHKYNTTTHTVKIPSLTLTDAEASGADVITQLTFTNGTYSTLVSTRTNIGNLKMTGYELPTSISAEALSANESLNSVLGKLEYRLNKEIDDRVTAINNLDYTDTADNTQIITEITQTDGKITNVARAAAGTLVLGDSYSKATTGGAIIASDSLNSAFGKVEKNIDDVNSRINTLIGEGDLVDAFDTIKEISDWLGTENSGAKKIVDDITKLNADESIEGSVAYSIKQAIDSEVTNRNTAIDNKINTLNVSDTPVDGQYVSGVSETNGIISVSRANLPVYTLTSGSVDGTVKFNNTDIAVSGLKSAAYREEVYFVSKTQYDLDMSTKDAQINGLNAEAKRLTNENINLANKVNELINRIEILESKLNLTE